MIKDEGNLLELPIGWAWAKLEELTLKPKSDIVDGPFGSNMKASEYLDEGIPIIRLQNIGRNLFLNTNIKFISYEKFKTLNRHKFVTGDIVITKLGEPLGKACIVPKALGEGIIVADIVRLRTDEKYVSKNYLVHLINSPIVIEQLQAQTKGTTRSRVNLSHIRELKILLPPLSEQRRIVTKIEALMARSQRAKEAIEAISPLLDQFRQSALAAAFRGDLTADWREKNPDVEPASVLLERIRAERRCRWEEAELEKMKGNGKTLKNDAWKAKYKEPESVDALELPKLPDGWCWVTADEFTSLITDGEHATPERSDDGVYLLSARNILNGQLSLEKVDFVPEPVYRKLEKRLRIEAGDVFLSCSGSVGRSCVAPPGLRCALIRSVAVLKPLFEMGEYLSWAIRSPYIQSQIEQKKTHTAQANIFQGRIKTLAIPVAPFDEQKIIVHAIAQAFKLIESVKQTLEDAKNRGKALDQSILVKAFRGELVPQDPNDEPASVLLERIRTERAKREAEAKGAKKSTGKTSGQRNRKAKQQDSEAIQLGLPGVE